MVSKSRITFEVEFLIIYFTFGVRDVVVIMNDVAVIHGIDYNIGQICVRLSDNHLLGTHSILLLVIVRRMLQWSRKRCYKILRYVSWTYSIILDKSEFLPTKLRLIQ